jgi:lipopolysaccharide transport system permease protein
VDFAIGLAVLIFITLGFKITPGAAVLWLPIFLLLALATALGVGLWLSALNALYRDGRYVTGFFIQFWMFASPVVYPSSLVPQRWRWLYGLNPMSGVIEGFRWALTGHRHPSASQFLVSALMVLAVLLGGLIFFQRMEGTVADMV